MRLTSPDQADALDGEVRPERDQPAAPGDQVAGLPANAWIKPNKAAMNDDGDQQHAPPGAEDRIALAAGGGGLGRHPGAEPSAQQAAERSQKPPSAPPAPAAPAAAFHAPAPAAGPGQGRLGAGRVRGQAGHDGHGEPASRPAAPQPALDQLGHLLPQHARPRDSRCLTASSLRTSAPATSATDWSSR